ncbi:hypothetical protein QFZ36_002295 [Pseudarthrobacter siccitolerans]|uniref:Uncharacterized protein n=1 Tax=Pseudarthrobacter siccitolerans TaxID=861266 RepID=A0ABU0PN85_9MICC|nr:hypothetical protein [Pseudarthrobacter siccitolerans]MDQ0674734.1 hypothetical protein [Pseudarthrobacter siccitolerans]
MSTDRLGGWLRRRFRTSRRGFVGVFDGGTEVSAAVEPSFGAVTLQLTVWEQRL